MALLCVMAITLSLSLQSKGVSLAKEANKETSSKKAINNDFISERLTRNYTQVSSQYKLPSYEGEELNFYVGEVVSGESKALLTDSTQGFEGSDKVADLGIGDVIDLNIKVPESGKYFLGFTYYSYDESILPIEFMMEVDGEVPFYEARNIILETTWKPSSEKVYDRYGNEIVTVPNKLMQWEEKYLMDSSYRHSRPLALELEEGIHTISLSISEGNFLLGSLKLSAPYEAKEYEGSKLAEGDGLITIQGEDYAYTNDSSIHAIAEYDTRIEPYEVGDTVLNTIDSASYDTAGQTITYEFEINKAGYYYIATNYRQSDKTDFPVFVDVRVDGQIPNKEFEAYPMAYGSQYTTASLKDKEGNKLSVYLDEGKHTLSYTISMDPIRTVLEEIDFIMSEVKDIELEITKVAGTNADKYRDLRITRYIPDLEEKLRTYADSLYELEQSMVIYSSSDKNVAVMSSMLIAAKQLISLADNTDEIAYRISELSSSANSVNQYLANTIDKLIANDLAIDRVYIYQEDAKLPASPGFIKSLVMNLKRFVTSFTDQAYSTSNTNPEHLQVWVNRPSQYVQIMQKMIDESFTANTGIEVDISIMPDQYKLVLANSSGDAPDIATGINYTIPYELAIRNALEDLTQFEDFKEVASPYEPGFFLTSTINEKVYALPETMNFWVLYYRQDIMEKLGLEVPETMDDVINMLPELQMRGLNYYYPTAGMITMRNFHGTTPLLIQHGGSLYYQYAHDGTAIGSENSVDGFTALTDLFTIYGMPVNVDNFYQHFRNGDLPIGVADYGVYNLLKNAAPELANTWSIAPPPGTVQEDGTIMNSTCGNAESTVMFKIEDKNRRDKAWEFMKWWSSTEVQSEFGQIIQITYGDEYMWASANLEAFSQLPWDTRDKNIIMEAAKNVIDVARIPGTYLLEREMSNAFNDITVNGDIAQTRIDKAVKTVNREVKRKLEEFGYIDSQGNVLEIYEIPTIDKVKEILGRNDNEE